MALGLGPLRATARFSRRKPLGAVGGAIVLALILIAILAPVIAPYGARELIPIEGGVEIKKSKSRVLDTLSSTKMVKNVVYLPPSFEFPLGTDHVGRDIRSRIIYGARISLYVGLGSVFIGITASFILGVTFTYIGGKLDLAFQRLVDALMALPGLIIALAIMAVLGSSLNNVILAIIIGLMAPVIRTVRSQVLALKEMEYITASRAVGCTAPRIIFLHIVPNCFAIYLVLATFYLGAAIIIEASLSFLGVGSPPDVPSWGGMLTVASREHVKTAPWAAIFPGLAIFVVVLGFNLLGDALRDVLDPRLRGSGK